jgi:hypothetical protein
MEIPKELFTFSTIATLGGAATATFVVCNAAQSAFNFNPKWLALAVAEVLMFAAAIQSGALRAADGSFDATQVVIVAVNGCLVFLTATGGTHVAGSARSPQLEARHGRDLVGSPKRRFLSPWW